MNRTLVTMTVCAMLLVAFPTTSSSEPTIHGTIITSGDPMSGTNDHNQECNGQLAALVMDVPGCDFELDTQRGFGMMMGFKSVNAGNVGPVPLTGAVTVHMISERGREVEFQCQWNDGTFVRCRVVTYTGWPSIGEDFEFDCYSAHDSVGNWGECFVKHAGGYEPTPSSSATSSSG